MVYRGTPGVEAVFERVCAERHVSLKKADFDGLRSVRHSLEGQVFDCGARKNLFLPLLGDHQLHNAAVVLSVADTLIEEGWKISEENIRDGLRDVRWPGRFDIMRRDPLFIIDGGHNPQCLDALVQAFKDYLPGRKITFLNGCMADKDYGAMFSDLVPFAKEFVTVTPGNPRALSAEDLAKHLERYNLPITPCASVFDGVATAIDHAGRDGVVCCCGSLYMISEICDALDRLKI